MFRRDGTRQKIVWSATLTVLMTMLLCFSIVQFGFEPPEKASRKNSKMGRERVVINSVLNEIRGSMGLTGPEKEKTRTEQRNFRVEHPTRLDSPNSEPASKDAVRQILHKSRTPQLKQCDLYPDTLVGRTAGNKACVAPEDLQFLYPDVELGGRVRPRHCVPHEKTAIIIPFRNRFTHLYKLLNNLIPFLQRQAVDVRFFVIEQALPTLFNRAALFNIGFLEALKVDDFDCFIFHDVDLIPLNDRNLYRCDEHPVHFAAAIDRYSKLLPYPTYFGGVVGFTREQYLSINGNSNLFFGWGGEDDDFYERIVAKDYEILRPFQHIGRYNMLSHSADKGNEDNCDRKHLLNSAGIRQDIEGLNTLKYKRNSKVLKKHMTWINVSLDMNEILATAPEFVRKEMHLRHTQEKNKSCDFEKDKSLKSLLDMLLFS